MQAGITYGINKEIYYILLYTIFTNKIKGKKILNAIEIQHLDDLSDIKELFILLKLYIEKYGFIIAPEGIKQLVENKNWSGKLTPEKKQEILTLLEHIVTISPTETALEIAYKTIKEKVNQIALMQGAVDAVQYIRTQEFEEVKKIMIAATQKSNCFDLGSVILDVINKEAVEELFKNNTERIPTGILPLDAKIQGLGRGELGTIIGVPKAGKSFCLQQMAIESMKAGYTVILYSFELREYQIMKRIISYVLNISLKQLVTNAMVKEHIQEALQVMQGYKGKLLIKAYSPRSANVQDMIYNIRDQLLVSNDPDVIIIDYGDEVGGSKLRKFQSRYEELGEIYSELRGLAGEFDCAVWTASQATRKSIKKDILDESDTSDSFRKIAVADIILTLTANEEKKKNGENQIFIAASRFCESKELTEQFKSNFEFSKFYDNDDDIKNITKDTNQDKLPF